MAEVESKKRIVSFTLDPDLIDEIRTIVTSGSDGYYSSHSKFVNEKLREAIRRIQKKSK